MNTIIKKPIPSIEGAFAYSDGSVEFPEYINTVGIRVPGKRIFGTPVFSKSHWRMDCCYKHKGYRVHHLIAEAFHGARPVGMVISHINENSLDNRPENLEYTTQKANMNMPGFKKKMAKVMTDRNRKSWENQEYRETMVAKMKARWADPEWKAKEVARRQNKQGGTAPSN